MRTNPDNAPEKKEEYRLKLETLTDEELYKQCRSVIWFSAFAANNPISCYHWQCDYAYSECTRRGNEDIYARAHKDEMRANGY